MRQDRARPELSVRSQWQTALKTLSTVRMDSYGNEQAPRVQGFLSEVLALCRKHGLSISHEDRGGAFVVVRLNTYDEEWLSQAVDETDAAA